MMLWQQIAAFIAWIIFCAWLFARVEIEIEGPAGWAANLPTWRVEEHPLLDWFWGSRAMTGYHAWMFSFMLAIFHLPVFVFGTVSWKIEARIFGGLMVFWILEDFLWFVLNPAFGLARFSPEHVPWHKRWAWRVPADYIVFLAVGGSLIMCSFLLVR